MSEYRAVVEMGGRRAEGPWCFTKAVRIKAVTHQLTPEEMAGT